MVITMPLTVSSDATLKVFLYSWMRLVDSGKLPIELCSQPAVSLLYQLSGTLPIL